MILRILASLLIFSAAILSSNAAVLERWSVNLPVETGTFTTRGEQVVADGTGGVGVVHTFSWMEEGSEKRASTITWINRLGKVIYSKRVTDDFIALISANSKTLIYSPGVGLKTIIAVNREGEEADISGEDGIEGLEGTLDNSFSIYSVHSDNSNAFFFRFNAERNQIAVVKIGVNLAPLSASTLKGVRALRPKRVAN